LYPNPASSVVTLEQADPIDEIVVSDIYGRVVTRVDGLSASLDLTSIAAGIYYVKTFSRGGGIGNAKLIKQ